jgi:4-hydroxy-tetrahydrodipicolinate synthase
MFASALHAQGRIPSPLVRLPLLAASPGATRAAVLLAAELARGARPLAASARRAPA